MTNILFNGRARSFSAPAAALSPVTPDDAADLPDGPARALFVGDAGDVAVVDMAGNEAVLASGAAQYHPVMVARVRATGTTAARIVALY